MRPMIADLGAWVPALAREFKPKLSKLPEQGLVKRLPVRRTSGVQHDAWHAAGLARSIAPACKNDK
jgi:hypothetical protein